MSEESIRAQKQMYLREHVLDKGLDIETFVQFMQGLKGNLHY